VGAVAGLGHDISKRDDTSIATITTHTTHAAANEEKSRCFFRSCPWIASDSVYYQLASTGAIKRPLSCERPMTPLSSGLIDSS
jgi:hypothetical protein